MPSRRENAYNLGVCPSKVTKLKIKKLPIDLYKFRKSIANESPLRYKFLAKIRNFDSFGGCIPTFLSVYRGNVSPLRGEKPIFGPLSKNNTGMAALRAGLPVITSQSLYLYTLWFKKTRQLWRTITATQFSRF